MDANIIFLEHLAERLQLVKDDRFNFPEVSHYSVDAVIPGCIYTLSFPAKRPIHVWVGINHTRIRFCIHTSTYSSSFQLFEDLSKALVDARQMGWEIQFSMQSYEGQQFGTIQGNNLINPSLFSLAQSHSLTANGNYFLLETAHVIQMLVGFMEHKQLLCPEFVQPGCNFTPVRSAHHSQS
jgi:hypothetical protein